ncbi:MAG: hypothetical protein FWD15_01390 [Alphaproteobacteria bacterium]|nr:hypothetical protein [Alphaproteobacteria bacterium]
MLKLIIASLLDYLGLYKRAEENKEPGEIHYYITACPNGKSVYGIECNNLECNVERCGKAIRTARRKAGELMSPVAIH